MRLCSTILISLLVIASLYVVLSEAQADKNNDSLQQASTNEPTNNLAHHKMFDFERFKKMFKKSYGSLREELRRQKLFFARAFNAFLSLVSFKHKRSTYHLKVNSMSDWTQAELDSMNNKGYSQFSAEISKQVEKKVAKKVADDEQGVDLKEIESGLKSLVENHKDEPGYKEIVKELKTNTITTNSRRKRSIIQNLLQAAAKALEGPSTPQQITKTDLPDEVFVDHREGKCFTPVTHQGMCGCCYIFSALALYEWQYCKETGKSVEFSQQYLLDCGDRGGLRGCDGGNGLQIAKFLNKSGIELSSYYPYQGSISTCPYDRETPSEKMGYIKVNEPKVELIHYSEYENYIKRMPIITGIGVSTHFSFYAKGVDVGLHCNRELEHAVLIVGSGREDGIEYWLIRNSYGSDWGLDGYYKLAKQATNCFLNRGNGLVLNPKDRKVFDDSATSETALKEHANEILSKSDNIPDWFKDNFNDEHKEN